MSSTISVQDADGTKIWYQNGLRHREDGPAVENADGSKCWYQNGKYHRLDGPAVELANGTKMWYKNGVLHREDGPAIEWEDGSKDWFKNGFLYQEEKVEIQSTIDELQKKEPKTITEEVKKMLEENKSKSGYSLTYSSGKINFTDNISIKYTKDASGFGFYQVFFPEAIKKHFNSTGNSKIYNSIELAYEDIKKYFKDRKSNTRHRIFSFEILKTGEIALCSRTNELFTAIGKQRIYKDENDNWFVKNEGSNDKLFVGSLVSCREYILLNPVVKIFNLTNSINTALVDGYKVNTDGNLLDLQILSSVKMPEPVLDKKTNPKVKSDMETLSQLINKLEKTKHETASNTGGFYALHNPNYDSFNPPPDYYLLDDATTVKVMDSLFSTDFSTTPTALQKDIEMGVEIASEEKKTDSSVKLVQDTALHAAKLVGARQGSRLVKLFVKSVIAMMLNKTNNQKYMPLLDSEMGSMFIELASPILIHAMAKNGFIPKYEEQIATVAEWSIEANINLYTLKYSDTITDAVTKVLTDSETRNGLMNLVKLGTMMTKAEEGKVNSVADFMNLDLSEIIKEKELV